MVAMAGSRVCMPAMYCVHGRQEKKAQNNAEMNTQRLLVNHHANPLSTATAKSVRGLIIIELQAISKAMFGFVTVKHYIQYMGIILMVVQSQNSETLLI